MCQILPLSHCITGGIALSSYLAHTRPMELIVPLLVAILIVVLVVYLIGLIPAPPKVKQALYVVVAVLVILWLVQRFGLL